MSWMTPGLRPDSRSAGRKAREHGFQLSSAVAPLPEYNATLDVHLRQLWTNPKIKAGMQSAGFLDEQGRAVDVDAHRRKLYVIEQELAQADCVERHRTAEKERRLRDRQVLAKRQEAQERHLRHVGILRDERRRKREAAREQDAAGGAGSPGTGGWPAPQQG